MVNSSWRLDRAAQDYALKKGEEIAKCLEFRSAPVDPFKVIASEGDMIHAEGADFRDCFDGRIRYRSGRFIIIYNTKYDRWRKSGTHHPKIRFTVGHELGHYYLDRHREYLVKCGEDMQSFTEFQSDTTVEREADAFSSGLLMPRYLLAPRVNRDGNGSISYVKGLACEFNVSLTSMLVRWTQLSHFPCALLCIRNGVINWGFCSEAFVNCGLWRCMRGKRPRNPTANCFLREDPEIVDYREGQGRGFAHDWLEGEGRPIHVDESYLAIPYSKCVLVFITADEDDLPRQWRDD